GGAVADAAAAYLRAGGTEVRATGASSSPWALTPALLEGAPNAVLQVVAAPRAPEAPGIVVGSDAGTDVLWSVAREGCRGCLRQLTQGLGPPALMEGASVQLGSLLALLVQRRAVVLASALEGPPGFPARRLAPPPSPTSL